jgi:hypothetical protein
MAIESANDTGLPGDTGTDNRDPKIVTIEGSSDPLAGTGWDAVTDWTLIYTNNDWLEFTNRFEWETNYFTNFTQAFTSYRWTCWQVQGTTANSLQVCDVQLLGATVPPNVVVPTDKIIGSSLNTPSSEGVANVISGTTAKYLNFDGATGPCGFIVTPSVGATVAQGLAMESANDTGLPGDTGTDNRDPKIVTLEGSDDPLAAVGWDAVTDWTLIYTNNDWLEFTNRFEWESNFFENEAPFTSYRWTCWQVQGTTANSMQICDVQILGVSAPVSVVLPTDKIIGSSLNTPSSEGVANVISGTTAKYLNFDGATGPCGFIVTPSVGATTITGMGIESANDTGLPSDTGTDNRDPKIVTLEGSDDPLAAVGWDAVTDWTLIYTNNDWLEFTNRFEWEYNYFPNVQPFSSYRWTCWQVQGTTANSLQVCDVQLLEVSSKAPCGQAAFVSTPASTPVLKNSTAEFFAEVNGPWPLQWFSNAPPYTNPVAIAGATKATYTTPPVTTANSNIQYTVGIVGCGSSAPVYAQLFTPSTVESIGIQFLGNGSPTNSPGANGSGVPILTNDVAGDPLQAYWNPAWTDNSGTSAGGTTGSGSGMSGDSNTLPYELLDSSNNPVTISFSFQTTGAWGSGTGTSSPTERLLGGLVGDSAVGTETYIFGNLPTNNTYSVVAYSVAPPLTLEPVAFAVTNEDATIPTIYETVIDSDVYNTAPGFYRATSTNKSSPSLGDLVRFDNLKPDLFSNIDLTVSVLGTPSSGRNIGLNAIQLLVNPPALGAPPTIVTQPQYTVAASNGTLTLTVAATGSDLSYQWRENGVPLPNGGAYSGANTATLTINPFTGGDVGVYSVAVFNVAGSAISGNAAVALTDYQATNGLLAYWPMDQKTGSNAPNSVSGGQPISFLGTVAWTNGEPEANAVYMDGSTTYGVVPKYTLATNAITVGTWVNPSFPYNVTEDEDLVRNWIGIANFTSGAAITEFGQFSFELALDTTTLNLQPTAYLGLGSSVASIVAPVQDEISSNGWHYVAFTADGVNLTLFLDGTNIAQTAYSGIIDSTGLSQPWLSIGCRLVTDTNTIPFEVDLDTSAPDQVYGELDDMAIWGRALAPAEISAIYQQGVKGVPLSAVTETAVVAGPTLTAAVSSGNLIISWTPTGGTLESATAITSNTVWTTVGTANPATVAIGKGNSFFRVSQ